MLDHSLSFILINFMIICFIIKTHCKRPTPNVEFTRRLYSVHTARSQRSRRPHSVATANTLWKRQAAAFVLSMLKENAAAWRSRRMHSVAGVCTARTSTFCNFFKRCGNAVRTPLWCDRDLTSKAQLQNI